MKFKAVIVFVKVLAIVTIAILNFSNSLAWAAGNQSNQDINQPAMLIAPNPEFKIKIYPKPDTTKHQIGYGLSGDRVTVIEQVGSNEGFTWNYVRFDDLSHVNGWIREDFVNFQESGEDRNQATTSRTESNQNQKIQKQYRQDHVYFDERQNSEPTNQRFHQNNQQFYQNDQRQWNR